MDHSLARSYTCRVSWVFSFLLVINFAVSRFIYLFHQLFVVFGLDMVATCVQSDKLTI